MLTNDPKTELLSCSSCGGNSIVETMEVQQFPYGAEPSTVTLSVVIPVNNCQDCGYQWTDERAEEIQHAAVCRHLGRLSPTQIIAIRNSNLLSRSDFSAIGGFGVASLQRWETGTLIQNEANDRFIYLLKFPENIDRLKGYESELLQSEGPRSAIRDNAPRHRSRQFRHIRNSQQAHDIAMRWELRGVQR